MKAKLAPAAEALRLNSIRASRGRHQSKFRMLWRVVSPSLSIGEEVTFTNRRWRLDFGNQVAKVGVEIQGGIWMKKGAHNTGTAIMRDCAKLQEAAFLGWIIFPLTPEQITMDTVTRIARFTAARAAQLADPYKEAR